MLLITIGRLIDRIRHAARKRRWSADMATGRRGEDLAHRFLQERGYTIAGRNFRTRSGSGEIDIVARDGDAVVFVEVKTRESAEFGNPVRAIDRDKEIAMRRAAREYCRRANLDVAHARFDVIGIVLTKPPTIRHWKSAIHS